MVSLVLVSHSRALAEAVVGLVRQVAPPQVKIAIAAGVGENRAEFGTDAVEIGDAVQSVYSSDGVIILMDLGSAILSAETALELLPNDMRPQVRLCAAPLVEGAISAAIQAGMGNPLDAVCDEARAALQPKVQQLGADQTAPSVDQLAAAEHPETPLLARDDLLHGTPTQSVTVTLRNPHGLHARPAARFIQTAASFDAEVHVHKPGSGHPPVSGKSLNMLATLGAVQGDQIEISAQGSQADQALVALRQLVEDGFGETEAAFDTDVERMTREPMAAAGAALRAIPVSQGIGIGPARRYHPAMPTTIAEYRVDDTAAEWQHLLQAIHSADQAIQRRETGSSQGDIFKAHRLILADEALLERARRLIDDTHDNAADAWRTAIDEVAAAYRALPDPYLQQRAGDVLDVGAQVLAALSNGVTGSGPDLMQPCVVVAEELTPTQIAQLDDAKVLAIVTGGGSANSHAAILARALSIPAVAGVGRAVDDIGEGTLVGVDGFTGAVWIDPAPEVMQALDTRRAAWNERQQQLRQASQTLTTTRDGHRIEVAANLSGLADARVAVANGAEAVGVLRTEFLYLTRAIAPSEEEQVTALRQIAVLMQGRPVIVRTLDVGGDKQIPYLPMPMEANPYLGVRAIRLSLQQPALFTVQVRAILRAGAEHELRILLPMVTLIEEVVQARQLIERAHEALHGEDLPHRWPIQVGIMVETPAAALQAQALAPYVDFFSIGTNDLTQYTLAAERGNPQLAGMGDALHPAVLRLIEEVVTAAHQHGKWAGVCGEIASDIIAVPVMVGLGLDELSLNVAAIPQVKAVVRTLDVPAAEALAKVVMRTTTAGDVRRLAQEFAAELARRA